jgi:hypothetical protein
MNPVSPFVRQSQSGPEHACPELLKSRAQRLDIGLVRAGGSLPHCSAAFDIKGGEQTFAAVVIRGG